MKSDLENLFLYQVKVCGLPKPEQEYRFHPTRRFRFDFAYPDRMIAIELEGGVYSGGRHTRGAGYEADCEKYNAAQKLGWQVYRFTSGMVKRGEAIKTIEQILEA